ncbi:MAG: hypothetical protein EHM49_03740 [Deltaproteobacteria bacterium]|nr:MAG: hypothetical protein EHM49_03740 [Deltaproteobacteria bacterium]
MGVARIRTYVEAKAKSAKKSFKNIEEDLMKTKEGEAFQGIAENITAHKKRIAELNKRIK